MRLGSLNAHSSKRKQGHDQPLAGVKKKWVSSFLQYTQVKSLDRVYYIERVVARDRHLNGAPGRLNILQRQFPFCNDPRGQAFKRSANLVEMNDVGFRQAENPGASPVPFCDKSFCGKNIECFTNGKLRHTEMPCPPSLDNFLTRGDSSLQNLVAKPGRQALLQESTRFSTPVSTCYFRFSTHTRPKPMYTLVAVEATSFA